MTKHSWRDSIKSFFGSHIDPERDEQLKETKIEIDDKVNKILKLIRDEDLDEKDGIHVENSKKETLVELIEDFHRQYQSLYSLYDHLTGELRKKVHGKHDKDSSTSSSSDSESDYSSKKKGSKNGQLESEFQKITDGIKQELENANLEVADLKRKSTATSEEKEALNSEYLIALSKIKEAETIIKDLKIEIERLDHEKSKLLVENGELDQKVYIAGKLEAELSQKLEDSSRENDNLIMEKETAMRRIEEGEKVMEDLRTVADRLKDEKVTLGLELEAVRGEVSNMKLHLESAEQQVADLRHTLNATNEENKSLTLKISEVLHEISQAQNVVQELMAESSQLKERLGEREREFSTLTEMHQVHGNESSDRIKELEAHVTGRELELGSLKTQKRDMEELIESKTSKEKQLGEENMGLQARTLELERISKEKGDEISILLKKIEDNESDSLSRIEVLTSQVNNLQLDADSLRTQKSELEEQMVWKSQEAFTQVKGLTDQVTVLQQELESLHSQKTELELQLQRKSQEISECMIHIENLKQDLTSMTVNQQKILEEKEGLAARVKDLEVEVDSLCNQKSELEEHMRTKSHETDQLREEKEGLQDRVLELERTLTERGDEFSALQEKLENGENEASAQIMTLTVQLNNLQQELQSLQTQKSGLELQIKREKQEYSESLTQMENQKIEVMDQITDQQRMLKDQEDAFNKLSEEHKQLEGWFQDCKANLEVAERKMEEMAEEFHKNIESKNLMVADLELMVEDLKRDLEEKGDELNTLIEKVRTIEVKLRLSNQKLRVTEQLLSEKEESLRNAELKFQQEQRVFEENIATLSGIIATNNEAHRRLITDISEKVNGTLTGLESVMRKFEEDCGHYDSCILEMSNELQIAKNWFTETNNEKEQLKKKIGNLVEQLQNTKEQELVLREKVEKLEVKASKEAAEKENLAKAVNQLEKKVGELREMMKEKDDGMLGLGEEKREAIRQLCVWIDYHRERNDYLKDVLSKITVRSQRARAT